MFGELARIETLEKEKAQLLKVAEAARGELFYAGQGPRERILPPGNNKRLDHPGTTFLGGGENGL